MSRRADGRWSGDPERKLKYNTSAKGQARSARYNHSVKGTLRSINAKLREFERETGVKI